MIEFLSLHQGNVFSRVKESHDKESHDITVDETENCELDDNKIDKFTASGITTSKNLNKIEVNLKRGPIDVPQNLHQFCSHLTRVSMI